ncbi:CARDB domain-containing protein [Kineococcus arenarius]|uniref:CARDB domain-containing protein n=1 Tax=Kineococcus sp. SYSU DK007 TaxID=3383128 RepID=UPI003D7F0558
MKRSISAATIGSALLGSVALTGPSQAATPRPDLTITDIAWTPQAAVAGQPVTFRATITNRGNAPTEDGVIHGIGFRVGGRTVTWTDRHTWHLDPGQSIVLQADGGPSGPTWPAAQGAATVTAHVDDAKRITESNESNNTVTETITATPSMSVRLRGDGRPSIHAAPAATET